MLFRDRNEAGELLADVLLNLRGFRPLVLGVPAGGVLIARVVAERLGAPLGAVMPEGCVVDGDVVGRTVIVVDEGIDTGATMRAALETVGAAGAARVVAAVPVAPQGHSLGRLAADLYAIARPAPLTSVRRWYGELPEVSEDEVRAALGRGSRRDGQDWAYAGATSL